MTDASLQSQVALITGGSRGIGLAIAQACADAGASVVITGRDEAALAAACATRPGAIESVQGDAASEEAAQACIARTLDTHGRLDILVNNAGGPSKFGGLLDLPVESFDATIALNLRGPFVWSRAAWQSAMKERGGVILNISSIGGLNTPRAMGAYSIAKAALNQMTRVLAAELAPQVRVNAIAPGLTRTEQTRPQTERGDLRALVPMERYGEPEDIAAAALFLLSGASSWITGQTLAIDGGMLVETGRLKRTKP